MRLFRLILLFDRVVPKSCINCLIGRMKVSLRLESEMRLLIVGLALVHCVFGKAADKLLSVQVLFRHGERTPIATYPNDPYNNILFQETESGQLTNVGKMHQYKLGQWLRGRYNDFLSTRYSRNEILVYSSDVDRVHMSAQCNLAGLYPPQGDQIWNQTLLWQPIPVHINVSILEGTVTNCPRYDALKKTVDNSEKIQAVLAQYQEELAYMSFHSGLNITDLNTLVLLRDTLYIEDWGGLPLPAWTSQIYPNPINELAALAFAQDTSTTEIAKLSIGSFLNTVLQNFLNPAQKFVMYSGHDSLVSDVMHVLEPDYENFCPEFASMVMFELWQGSKNQYVRFYLKRNDTVENLVVKKCSEKCVLSKFKTILETVAISPDTKKKLCEILP